MSGIRFAIHVILTLPTVINIQDSYVISTSLQSDTGYIARASTVPNNPASRSTGQASRATRPTRSYRAHQETIFGEPSCPWGFLGHHTETRFREVRYDLTDVASIWSSLGMAISVPTALTSVRLRIGNVKSFPVSVRALSPLPRFLDLGNPIFWPSAPSHLGCRVGRVGGS